MRKQLIILSLSLLCTALVVVIFPYTQSYLNAMSSTYNLGEKVTTRINKAPSNLSGSKTDIGFKSGDKIAIEAGGGNNAWQLGTLRNYTTYNCPITLHQTSKPTKCTKPAISAWLSLATKTLASDIAVTTDTAIKAAPWIVIDGTNYSWYGWTLNSMHNQLSMLAYKDQAAVRYVEAFNSQLNATHDIDLITYNNESEFFSILAAAGGEPGIDVVTNLVTSSGPDSFGRKSFIANNYIVTSLSASQMKYPSDYWLALAASNKPGHTAGDFIQKMIGSSGIPVYYSQNRVTGGTVNVPNMFNIRADVRPTAYIDLNSAVFATSASTGTSSISAINATPANLLSTSSHVVNDTAAYGDMIVRLLDTSMTASLNSTEPFYHVSESQPLNKQNNLFATVKGSKIRLKASGSIGGTLSAVIFDNQGKPLYYAPLGAASGGEALYEVDTSSLAEGQYQIAVVNEVLPTNREPSKSSAFSQAYNLLITKEVTVNVTPKTGLEVSKNVNQNDVVATFTTSNGVAPITTTLVSDTSVSGHENDYQLFSLSNGNVVVKGPDGLAAGDYYFKINAIDSNGDPEGGVDSATVHIVVGKTNLTVAFNDPNTTKKSISDAATPWSETATANPSTGTKITYSKSGGYSALIEIDPDTGEITYNGNDAFNKVTICATADDDPSTGLDNYEPAYAEKEIIIYRGVNAAVTPDSASSDTTIPTFTASQSNVMGNGVIGTITGNEGTPDTIGGSTTTYSYQLVNGQDSGMFQLTTSGNVGTIKVKAGSQLGVGSYHFTIKVSDKWSSKDVAVTVNVGVAGAENLQFYETSAAINMITSKSVTVTDTNITVFATVKGSTNTNPVKYKIEDGSTNVIEVNENSGAITIHGVGTVTIVAEKKGGTGQADAQAKLTFTVTAGTQNFIYTDNAGNELPKSGSNYSAKTDTYAPNKTFQLYTAGNPTGSSVTYQLKAGSPTDVISVDASGLVTILNASLNNQMGRVIIQATSHDPSGNYADKTIELPINIDKGTRTIAFVENPIYVVSGSGSVTPVTEVDGVTDTDGDVLIEVDHNEDNAIAWTSDNKTIEYDYSEPNPKDIKIHATKPMNRNYKAAEADGVLHIMGPDENVLAITSPGKITYGDHFTIRSSQYDADSTNVQYTFEVDDTTYISNPTVSGNSAEFDAKQFSGSNKTTITVTRTADGETPLSKQVQVSVLPKPIEIIIDDKEKLKGEQNPSLTYQDFKNKLVSWNGVQDVIQANDIKLSTTAKTDSNAGSYPIKGDANTLNKTYPNYSFSFKQGTLTIKEETIEDDWYHLELDDGNNTAYTGDWTNQNVNIISDHNEYINLSLDQSTWNPSQVTIISEGEINQSFWMKKDSGAITKEKQEIIKIDKIAPNVKNIKAKDTNNKLQDIINKISGGIFFKPGTSFEVTTTDAEDDLKVSGTKEIAYKVYKTEKQSRAGDELIKDGTLTVTNEKASITISELTGSYKVCVTATDNAGNTNTESCHEVELKKIDVDVDDDGKPDFNDPDGDGCPDLNIKWKDPENPDKWIVVNGDRNYDGLPDLNIDSDGDGKPDLNIDTDNDGKPDLNLVILKKGEWKPTKCVKADPDNGILEEYCTGTSVKPVINVDTDNDGIPNINIDSDGDMKADINIQKNGYMINVAEHDTWKPNQDYTFNKFLYDTEKIKPVWNIDSDGNGYPDVNVDIDGDGIPDINIDTDGDGIPNTNIDSNGDGIADVNVDEDGDGVPDKNIKEITTWKPNITKDDTDYPFDTMDFTDDSKDPDVKGSYYPGDEFKDNIGGAITGDTTDLIRYMSLCFITSGISLYAVYKRKTDN